MPDVPALERFGADRPQSCDAVSILTVSRHKLNHRRASAQPWRENNGRGVAAKLSAVAAANPLRWEEPEPDSLHEVN